VDFELSDEQAAVRESAAAVFGGMADAARVGAVEATADRVDEELWQSLAQAHLLGLVVPEVHGGAGLGLLEACMVLEQQGRHVAPVPLWATTVGALAVARLGRDDQQRDLLPDVCSGARKMSAALTEVAASPGRRPAVTARADGAGWRLSGTAMAVPQAHVAGSVLVPAAVDGDGPLLVAVVDPTGPGVTLERALTTDRQVHPHLHLDGARVAAEDVLAAPGRGEEAVDLMVDSALTGLGALAVGVCEEAVTLAAAYCNQRQQFGKPLAAFQGTLLRAADAYIDTEAIRVTTWQAAWRIDTGRPAAVAVAAAKWWASEAGQRVVHATQHLHGGLGADVSYPIHRYFLWGKQIELLLGGPASQLARLGTLVADDLRARSGVRSQVPA